ncbi:hypothetical protein [Allopontixanthobacter sp.]|uniref:hypothetical protein n=1 Tax=Allopontixanthobacter sp. TaxID=2906452 RepID=UPI002ABC4D7F|nr:hypothetical protein [Allopontixanthobacter sp.]MDZ4306446.1 hypothetical protein [Allopontixanthobacter sp.]
MMGRLWLIPFAGMCIYSAVLLGIEASTSQDVARIYFTDIGMPSKPGRFAPATGHIGYGVNTSLSAFLFECAGAFAIFAALADRKPYSRAALFFFLQGLIFVYLGLDDRFMLHERLGAMLNIYSSIVLILAVILNALLYLWLFRSSYFNGRMVILLLVAGGLSGAMLAVDFVWPKDMVLRLSVEDLLKSWSGFFFLLFAWEAARFRLVGQPQGERAARFPDSLISKVPARWRDRFTA